MLIFFRTIGTEDAIERHLHSVSIIHGYDSKMTNTETEIRPDIVSLKNKPTLTQVSETWGTLELKLETGTTRYWITTRGLTQQSHQAPINYVQGYVTIEKKGENGSWNLSAVYSPDAWKLSQAFDYCRMLQQELHESKKQLQEDHSWTLRNRIDELNQEISQVKDVILKLSAKLREE